MKKTFEEYIAEEDHRPTAESFLLIQITLGTSWALAQEIFGDLARPEHAFTILHEMEEMRVAISDGDDEDLDPSECDNCGHKADCHPTAHGEDGTCYAFVEQGQGCDNCSQHKDAHGHDGRSNDVCAEYAKS